MGAVVFLAAAVLLAVERLCYIWVWHRPQAFTAVSRSPLLACFGEPVDVLRVWFYSFKALQGVVFAGWWMWFAGGVPWPPGAPPTVIAVGGTLILAGQLLSAAVFRKLGNVGVFYGNRLGHELAWVTGFPFNVVRHPQYVGTVLSIWGMFLIMRFPHPDWYALPLLETLYYALGARYER